VLRKISPEDTLDLRQLRSPVFHLRDHGEGLVDPLLWREQIGVAREADGIDRLLLGLFANVDIIFINDVTCRAENRLGDGFGDTRFGTVGCETVAKPSPRSQDRSI